MRDLDFFFLFGTQGYAPICLGLEDFYVRRLYLRIQVLALDRRICLLALFWFREF
jgi:serine palmitoyltransferase